MKRKFLVCIIFLILSFSFFSLPLKDFLSDYYSAISECVYIFDENYREKCVLGVVENFKTTLLEKSKDKNSSLFGAKILSVSFFRNERKTILFVPGEAFEVDSSGKYSFTFINGTPSEKKSKVRSLKILLWDGKRANAIFESNDLSSKELFDFDAELDKGVQYTFIVEDFVPVASYFTIVVTDKKISL